MRKGNKENIKKEFTIRERKDIINEEHNLLNKDENFYEREGLYVMKTKDVVLNETKNQKGKLEKLLTKICIDLKINNYKAIIKKFLDNKEEYKK